MYLRHLKAKTVIYLYVLLLSLPFSLSCLAGSDRDGTRMRQYVVFLNDHVFCFFDRVVDDDDLSLHELQPDIPDATRVILDLSVEH